MEGHSRSQEVVTFSDDHQHETAHYEASQPAPHVTEDPNHPDIPVSSPSSSVSETNQLIVFGKPKKGGGVGTHLSG